METRITGFADPYVCNCVYIGNEADFQKYQQLKLVCQFPLYMRHALGRQSL